MIRETFEDRIKHFLDPESDPVEAMILSEDVRRLIEERDQAQAKVEDLQRQNRHLYLYGVIG